jgi:hypothetical protein
LKKPSPGATFWKEAFMPNETFREYGQFRFFVQEKWAGLSHEPLAILAVQLLLQFVDSAAGPTNEQVRAGYLPRTA